MSSSGSLTKDDEDEEEERFEQAVAGIVAKIENEIQTHGDAEEDTNKMKNVEFHIQADRIINILDLCIEKMEIAFCLPFLDDDNRPRNRFGDTKNMKSVMELFAEISLTDDSVSCSEMRRKKILQCVDAAYTSGAHKLCDTDRISDGPREFLRLLRDLKEVIRYRIMMTAPKEMAKEKTLQKMWVNNERAKRLVAQTRTQLDEAEETLEGTVSDLHERQESMSKTIDEINQEFAEKIENEVYMSNLVMNKMGYNSKLRQAELQTEYDRVKEQYDKMLETNLAAAKKLSSVKLRETQKLQSWLTKYDTDVGDRSQVLFKLKDEYEEVMRNYTKCKEEFDFQEIEYTIVMAEKEEEDRRIREEKMLLFMQNRAARLLQRAYRSYRKRKARRGKKGKKGKKK